MSIRFFTITAALFAMGLSGTAFAKKRARAIRVNVKVCKNGFDVRMQTFNGRDGSMTTSKDTASVKARNETGRASCRGQGKGLCKIKIRVKDRSTGKTGTSKTRARNGQWIWVKPLGSSGTRATFNYEVLDSEPTCPALPASQGGSGNGSAGSGPN